MINDLPTIFEIVNGIGNGPTKKQQKEKTSATKLSNGESKSNAEMLPKLSVSKPQTQENHSTVLSHQKEEEKSNKEDEGEHGETLCGSCGGEYAREEFWICCNTCEKWFHCECVKMTLEKSIHINQYICSMCSYNYERARS